MQISLCFVDVPILAIKTVLSNTHSVFTAIFPGEPVLAGCSFNSTSPFIPELRILLGRA